MHFPRLAMLAAIGQRVLAMIVGSAVLVGVIVGYAAAALTDDKPLARDAPAPRVSSSPSTGNAGAVSVQPTLRPSVVSAILTPATTSSGLRRRRARVTVTVRLRNSGDRRHPAIPIPVLIVGGSWIRVDPAARQYAHGVLKPVWQHRTAVGALRFETAGDVTDRLTRQRRARLRIAGRILNVVLTRA